MLFDVRQSIPDRPSPKQLLSGVENLALGQSVMGVFRLVEFDLNRHLTIVLADQRAIAIFGEIAASYVVVPRAANTCRLILKGHVRYISLVTGIQQRISGGIGWSGFTDSSIQSGCGLDSSSALHCGFPGESISGNP
ncbi:MAG: hypothetical protein KME12_24030 [Trichocoleus desertorum ATA4-8-CV12]|jgi:hypothetical protein|nr:hypothetical protein [Trichocoleus desertorum ATA4-8-CV12]